MNEPWDVPVLREHYLYNPGEAFRYDYGNETFSFPAHNEHWTDPATKQRWHEPGVMPVRPHKAEHSWDHRFKDQYGNPVYSPEKHTDREVIEYFIGTDGKSGALGRVRGIRRLSPSDHKDEAYDARVKQDARASYLRARYESAQKNVERFKAANAKAAAEGRPQEPANDLILADFKYISEYLSLANQGARYQCSECLNRFAEQKGENSLEQHILSIHAPNAQELLAQHGLVEKKKPGRKKREAVAA